MQLITESYLSQINVWPKAGRHILAQYDDDILIVYQAYRPSIGNFAAKQGYFGGEGYQINRMSWIKTNFLWMMYRSGWGTKPGQEIVLAIWLKRSAFDFILEQSVHSSFVSQIYKTEKLWKSELARSSVRLQWDPDHNPSGNKIERRAIQLGLRGDILRQFAQDGWIVQIEDITSFVAEQSAYAQPPYTNLVIPQESVYPVHDDGVAQRIQITVT